MDEIEENEEGLDDLDAALASKKRARELLGQTEQELADAQELEDKVNTTKEICNCGLLFRLLNCCYLSSEKSRKLSMQQV